MNDTETLAKNYAEALFNLSGKENNLAAVEKAFDEFVHTAYQDRRFAAFMESPVIPLSKKEEFLLSVLQKDTPQLLVLFLRLVLAKKRFSILRSIESAFQTRSEKHRGIRKAELISAVPMESATQKKLTSILEKKLSSQIRLVSKTDPDLLGGFILKLDERVVDASYKTKLREMRQRLSAAPV